MDLVQSDRERMAAEVKAAQQERVAQAVSNLRTAVADSRWQTILGAACELETACVCADVDDTITNWIAATAHAIAKGMKHAPTKTDRKCAAFLVGTIETLLDWDCGI